MNAAFRIGWLFLAAILFTATQPLNAQTDIHENLRRADKQFDLYAYNLALRTYGQAVGHAPNNAHALARSGDCYFQLNRPQEALAWYDRAVMQAGVEPETFLHYGQALMQTADYVKARKWFWAYAEKNAVVGKHYAKMCDFAIQTSGKNGIFQVRNEPLNTATSDYSPSFYGGEIVYNSARTDIQRNTSARTSSGWTGSAYNQLYVTQRNPSDNYLQRPAFFRSDLLNNFNEGPVSFSGDGKRVAFCRNNFIDGARQIAEKGVNMSLYFADVSIGNWQNAKAWPQLLDLDEKLSEVNWRNVKAFPYNGSSFSTGFPTLSADGNTLYFASNQNGGYGGWDIYISFWNNNTWSPPRNLGPIVNTPGNEVTPYISGNTLYFSSDWHYGLGGLDVFRADIVADTFQNVEHLGAGINSSRDDYGFIFDPAANIGYLTSNRPEGRGNEDIWQARKRVDEFVITVNDSRQKPIPYANIDLSICKAGVKQTDTNGRYSFSAAPGTTNCRITISKTGFRPEALTIRPGDKEKITVVLLPIDHRSTTTDKTTTKTTDKSDCEAGDCSCILNKIQKSSRIKDYESTIALLQAYKVCSPDSSASADKMILEVFQTIEREKRAAYANDLAFKAQTTLKDKDNKTALRLAELAYQYVDDNNHNVHRALVEAYHFHERPNTLSPLISILNKFKGHSLCINSVSFSPNGDQFATASDDGTAKIWDLESGKVLQTLDGHASPLRSVLFSPDGRRLATASEDKTIKIWDLETMRILFTLNEHTAPINSLSFSPEKNLLASASADSSVKIWNLTNGKVVQTLHDSLSPVLSVSFSPDGRSLATGCADATAKIWDWENVLLLKTFKSHTAWVRGVSYSSNGRFLATCSDDQTVKVWDCKSGRLLRTLDGNGGAIWSVSYSPDGQHIAAGTSNGVIRIWNPANGHITATIGGHQSGIWCLAFSIDGNRLATGSLDKSVKIWETESGQLQTILDNQSSGIRSVSLSPDGSSLATGSSYQDKKGFVNIWDLKSGQLLLTLKSKNSGIWSVAFSPDGRRLAVGASDHTAKIWDLLKDSVVNTLSGHTGKIISLGFSFDGSRLATGSTDSTAKIWNLVNGELRQTLKKGHSAGVWNVAFSTDGDRLATASADKTVKIWDLESGKVLQTLEGHKDWVISVAFSPADQHRLATGSSDKTAIIWDMVSGKALHTLQTDQSGIWSISFSADGQRVATGADDGTEKIWFLDPNELIKTAREKQRIGTLNLTLLKQYGLDNFFDAWPAAENLLCQNGETEQILAFADFFADRARRLDDLARTGPDYSRASRLYTCGMAKEGDLTKTSLKLTQLYHDWSFACLIDNLPDSAYQLARRAMELSSADRSIRQQAALSLLAKPSSGLSAGIAEFSEALAILLSLMETDQAYQKLLADVETIKDRHIVIPCAQDVLRLLLFDRVDSLSAKRFGISLPPSNIPEEDLLEKLPDTLGLFYRIRKLERTGAGWVEKARQLEQAAVLYAQLAAHTDNSGYKNAQRQELLKACNLWRKAANNRDTILTLREQYLFRAFQLYDQLDSIIEIDANKKFSIVQNFKEEILRGIAHTQFQLALLYLENKKYHEAIKDGESVVKTCEELIRFYPENSTYKTGCSAIAQSYLSWTYLLNHQPSEALQVARSAADFDNLSPRIAGYLAHAFLCNGRIDNARRHYLSAALEKDRGQSLVHTLVVELIQLDTIYPGIGASILPLLQSHPDTLLAEAVRADIPKAREIWRARQIEIAIALEATIAAAAEAQDYRTAADTSLAYIATCRALFAVDSTSKNRERLGNALARYGHYACFAAQPVQAVAAAREAASLLKRNWPRAATAHGYLLNGQWKKAEAEYRALKDLPDDSGENNGKKLGETLWVDIHTFSQAGIRPKKLRAAAEVVLGRKLTEREKQMFF